MCGHARIHDLGHSRSLQRWTLLEAATPAENILARAMRTDGVVCPYYLEAEAKRNDPIRDDSYETASPFSGRTSE